MAKKNTSEHDARNPAPDIVLERALRPDELPAQPAKLKPPRRTWAMLCAACLIALTSAGYILLRARPPTDEARKNDTPAIPAARTATTTSPVPHIAISDLPAPTSMPARVAATSDARYGALRLTLDAPQYVSAYLTGISKRVWVRQVFAKAATNGNNAWREIAMLPHILTNLPAGATEVALELEGFDIDTASRRIIIPVGTTADVNFVATPHPATLTVDCNVKDAQIGAQMVGEEQELPFAVDKQQQLAATVPALRPLIITANAPGYFTRSFQINGITPGKNFHQTIELAPVPPPRPRRISTIRRRAGREIKVALGNDVALELIWIPSGEFIMGSPDTEMGRYTDEGPQHLVIVSQGFWIGKHELTQAQWEQVTGKNPSRFQDVSRPVEQVSWDDCLVFLGKLNEIVKEVDGEPVEFQLPSEAEWEYACRAGIAAACNNGRELTAVTGRCPYLNEVAWYSANSDGKSQPGGLKKANAWGLYDMHGNIWEWCRDGKRAYDPTTQTDPEGAGDLRVSRGGSWGEHARLCRAAARYALVPRDLSAYIGLRVIAR